jgi:hypothetical protein
VFAYEFGNYECGYNGEYDKPYEIVKSVYGDEIANKIINDKDLLSWLNGDDEDTDNE